MTSVAGHTVAVKILDQGIDTDNLARAGQEQREQRPQRRPAENDLTVVVPGARRAEDPEPHSAHSAPIVAGGAAAWDAPDPVRIDISRVRENPVVGILHVFDMDGTLLPGSSASFEIARALGNVDGLVALEARHAAGEVDSRGFATAVYRMWRDLTPAVVAAAFAASPWLVGIREVCADIRRRGEWSAVITLSPDFFAAHLLELGFDEVVASRFPPLPFRETLDLAGILNPIDKVRIVEDLRARYALSRSCCVAYGDSMSDVPLFQHLEATVAINADKHLDGIAAASYHGNDLIEAYALARALIPSSQSASLPHSRSTTMAADGAAAQPTASIQ
jgi:phosphoserine phosphatase